MNDIVPHLLDARFGISDLDTYRFREIVSWHPAAETTPLRLEMLRFSQVSNKAVFDDVFVRYGRSLKPDLIVAQWNHLGNLSQIDGDELPRCRRSSGAGMRPTSGIAPAVRPITRTSRTTSSARRPCKPATSGVRSMTVPSRWASTKARGSGRPLPSWRPTAAPRWGSTRNSLTLAPAPRS